MTSDALRRRLRVILQRIRESWLAQWLLANSLAWAIAIVLAALLVRITGAPGILVTGIIIGAIVGAIQSPVLTANMADDPPERYHIMRHWTGWSAAGGCPGSLAVLLLPLFLLQPFIGLMLMGIVFGGSLGFMQMALLRQWFAGRAIWWVIACAGGGALCAPLTLMPTGSALPLLCVPGTLFFGLVTGLTLLRLSEPEIDRES